MNINRKIVKHNSNVWLHLIMKDNCMRLYTHHIGKHSLAWASMHFHQVLAIAVCMQVELKSRLRFLSMRRSRKFCQMELFFNFFKLIRGGRFQIPL